MSRLVALSSTTRMRGGLFIAAPRKALWHILSDFGQQSARAKGLSHIRITPSCASLVLVAAQSIGGHNYDRNGAQCRIGLDAARCFIAIKHRQLDVHQDQIGSLSRRSS